MFMDFQVVPSNVHVALSPVPPKSTTRPLGPHVPLTHVAPTLRAVHFEPPPPQALLLLASWHVPSPSQHPLGHETPSQTHALAAQRCPAAHVSARHMPPHPSPAPHALPSQRGAQGTGGSESASPFGVVVPSPTSSRLELASSSPASSPFELAAPSPAASRESAKPSCVRAPQPVARAQTTSKINGRIDSFVGSRQHKHRHRTRSQVLRSVTLLPCALQDACRGKPGRSEDSATLGTATYAPLAPSVALKFD